MLENLFAKAQLITERQNYCFHTQLFIYKASTIEQVNGSKSMEASWTLEYQNEYSKVEPASIVGLPN